MANEKMSWMLGAFVTLQCYIATITGAAITQTPFQPQDPLISKIQGPGSIVKKNGLKELRVNAGDSIALQCAVSHYYPSASWYTDKSEISLSWGEAYLPDPERYSIELVEVGNVFDLFSILRIRSLVKEDEGRFRCNGPESDDWIQLYVSTPTTTQASIELKGPVITNIEGPGNIVEKNGQKELMVISGDSIALQCAVSHYYPFGLWYTNDSEHSLSFGGSSLPDPERYSVYLEDVGNTGTKINSILRIQSLKKEDEGRFRCNGPESDDWIQLYVSSPATTQVPIELKGPAITKIEGPGNIVEKNGLKELMVNFGDSIALQCTVSHYYPFGFWYTNDSEHSLSFGGSSLPDPERYSVYLEDVGNTGTKINSILRIQSLIKEDEGRFRCNGPESDDWIQLYVSNKQTVPSDGGENAKECGGLKRRRYDISDLGSPRLFRGWVDVQGQGAANDYCRVVSKGGPQFLSCALAGALDDHVYTSPNAAVDLFDAGHTDTWYMKDQDGDGRDDYCRCVGMPPNTVMSCMKAGDSGFLRHDDFQIEAAAGCHYNKTNPFFGVP